MAKAMRYAGYGGLALVAILSPALVTLGVPFAYGLASDIVENAGISTVCLSAIAAAIALNARRRSALRSPRNRSPDAPARPISALRSPR
jgi:hypothetical protein